MKTKSGEILFVLTVVLFSISAYAGRTAMQLTIEQRCKWNLKHKNASNKLFWDLFTLEMFNKRVDAVGLSEGEDLQLAMAFIRPLDESGPARVLEVGANHGRVVDFLLDKTSNLFIDAVEYSRAALNLQSKYENNPRVRVIHDSILDMPLEDGSYDAVFLFFSTDYEFSISERRNTLYPKIRRALKPNGFVLIDNPDVRSIGGPLDYFQSRYVRARHPRFPEVYLGAHVVTNDEVEGMLHGAGFDRVTCTIYPVGEDINRFNCIARK